MLTGLTLIPMLIMGDILREKACLNEYIDNRTVVPNETQKTFALANPGYNGYANR